METAARSASRASTALRSAAARKTARSGPRRILQQQQSQRAFSNSTTGTRLAKPLISASVLGGLFLATGTGLYAVQINARPTLAEAPELVAQGQDVKPFTPTKADYQAVYNAIAAKLIEEDDYDDGSYGPVLLRLGWHSSGSYDAATNTGGSNGATMRFPPEGELPANSGLRHARDFLEPVKEQFPWISYSDLWILGAVCAVQEMGGPDIPWRPGRRDRDVSFCSPDGRLPDGSKGSAHLRAIFGRMGFNDQEIVALSGGHAVGRCHVDRSGFEGPWSFSPITFTNVYYKLLLDEQWLERPWSGPRQFEDKGSKTLMMLPTDVSLVEDAVFKGWVGKYAADEEFFFRDFSNVMVKLFELGVPKDAGSIVLQRSE